MNLAIRKLALLEKSIMQQEEESRIQGYSTCTIDSEFRNKISDLMDKVRKL